MGKEALDDDDNKKYGQRDRRRRRRVDGQNSAHPLLSLTLSPYSLFEFVLNCADEYRKNIEEDRRDSLSFWNIEGKCQRDFQAEINSDECHRVHESYEIKWDDTDEHRKQMREEQRKIFEFRNAEGKRQRDLQPDMESDERHRVHESYEGKWAGEKDADEYKNLTSASGMLKLTWG